jgi:hypothetical protein
MTIKPPLPEEILLRRYLLGETPAEEQRSIEQRLLADADYFHQLLKAEEDLTDDYVYGNLEQLDEERFEKHFLNSPERRKSLKFAQSLARYISLHAQRQPDHPLGVPLWRRAGEVILLCAVIVLAAALSLQIRRTLHLREQIEQERIQRVQGEERERVLNRQLEEERSQVTRLSQELAGRPAINADAVPKDLHPAPATSLDLVSLVLAPGLNRDAREAATARLGPGINRLQVELKTKVGARRSYHVELQTVEGEAVLDWDGLKAWQTSRGNAVRIVLRTALLQRSDYLLVLSITLPAGGSEKVGTYYFRVIHE